MIFERMKCSMYYNSMNTMKANITEWKMKLKEEEEKLQECEEEIKKKHEDADLAIVELACSS